MKYAFVFNTLAIITLSACSIVSKPTDAQLQALNNPPPTIQAKVKYFLPAAVDWYATAEQQFAPKGRYLNTKEQMVAQRLGIQYPEQVRIVLTKKFPLPPDPELRKNAQRYGMGSAFAAGFTLGHTILIKPDYAKDHVLIAHELVHVQQIERMGRAAFVQRYITEMEMFGYRHSPLEWEAYQKQKLAWQTTPKTQSQ